MNGATRIGGCAAATAVDPDLVGGAVRQYQARLEGLCRAKVALYRALLEEDLPAAEVAQQWVNSAERSLPGLVWPETPAERYARLRAAFGPLQDSAAA